MQSSDEYSNEYQGQGKPKPLINVRTFQPDPRHTRRKKKEVYVALKLAPEDQHFHNRRVFGDSDLLREMAGFLPPLPVESPIVEDFPRPKVKPMGKPILDVKAIRKAVFRRMAEYESLFLMQKLHGRGENEQPLVRMHGNIYATMDAILDIFIRQFNHPRHVRATKQGWSIKVAYAYIAKQRQLGNCLVDDAKEQEKAYHRKVRTVMNHVKRLEYVGVFTKRRSVGYLSDDKPNSNCIEIIIPEKYVIFKDERHNLAFALLTAPIDIIKAVSLPKKPQNLGKSQESSKLSNLMGAFYGNKPDD